jgi:hypothetical protein
VNFLAFRTLCANPNTTKAAILAALMAVKRRTSISAEEKDAICAILQETNHTDLAAKFRRNRKRHLLRSP